MALEAVVYPQDLFSYGCKDLYSLGGGGGGWSYEFGVKEEERGCSGGGGEIHEKNIYIDQQGHLGYGDSSSSILQNAKELETNSGTDQGCTNSVNIEEGASTTPGRRKRRRTKSCKNKEEVENQRMTHIVVERNRRKQMNEYLSVLRSLMPSSYVQRSDQASIVGGAINFVKELEQLLQSLEAQKRMKQQQSDSSFSSPPFAEFFTSPQYSSCSTHSNNSATMNESVGENRSLIADIKVTMVESHSNLKVLTKRRPKQLLKMVTGFQTLRLTILHLNITTIDDMVLYSFSVKIEDECQLTSVDEIATAVHQMLDRIQVEAALV